MRIENVNPNELIFRDNVRWRADSDLSELMESIKQNGIQVPIKVREEDKTIVYGHRRIAAAIKLQLEKVPVIFESGIDDKGANVLNLLENIQRKDVSSIEIGRQCDLMLKNKKFQMTMSELATALGVSEKRVNICLEVFKRLPEKYREKVVHLDHSRKRKFGELPENVVMCILNIPAKVPHTNREKIITDKELDIIFEEAGKNKLTVAHINLITLLLCFGMSIKQAIKELNLYEISRLNFVCLKTELADARKKEGIFLKRELFNCIIKKTYPNLVY